MCLLLGYVGTPSEWESFNIAWNTVLKKFEVQEFHAAHFFPPERRQSHKDQYRGWSSERRIQYLDKLLSIITTHQILPIGRAVDIAAFRTLTLEQRRYVTGAYLQTDIQVRSANNGGSGPPFKSLFKRKFTSSGAQSRPYMLALILFLRDLLDISPPDSLLNVVLDYNQLKPVAVQTFTQFWKGQYPGKRWLNNLTFMDSSTQPQLQAADMLAYAWYRSETSSIITDEVRHTIQILSAKKDYLKIADSQYFKKSLDKLRQDLESENLPWLSGPDDGIEVQRNSDDK